MTNERREYLLQLERNLRPTSSAPRDRDLREVYKPSEPLLTKTQSKQLDRDRKRINKTPKKKRQSIGKFFTEAFNVIGELVWILYPMGIAFIVLGLVCLAVKPSARDDRQFACEDHNIEIFGAADEAAGHVKLLQAALEADPSHRSIYARDILRYVKIAQTPQVNCDAIK